MGPALFFLLFYVLHSTSRLTITPVAYVANSAVIAPGRFRIVSRSVAELDKV